MSRRMVVLWLLAFTAGCERVILGPSEYGEIRVSVTTRAGEAVPAAGLELYTGVRPMAYARTGADGTFTFEHVPRGNYGIVISPPEGYEPMEFLIRGPVTTRLDNLAVGHDSLPPLRFTLLKRGAGTVSVEVSSTEGVPLAGVEATLYNPLSTTGKAITDAGGRAVFSGVPFGVYGVTIVRPSGYRDIGEVPYVQRDNLVVDEGAVERAPFALARCSGSILVRVVDEHAQAAGGVSLSLYTAVTVVRTGITAADGAVRFSDVGCDEYGVAVNASPGYAITNGRGTSFIDGLRVRRESSLSTSFSVRSCRSTIGVRVQDANGAPVAGATATLYSALGAISSGQSGADGRLTFTQAPCGIEVGVSIKPPAGYSVSPGRNSSYFDGLTPSNGVTLDVVFRLNQP